MAQRAWSAQGEEEPTAETAIHPVIAQDQDDDPVNAALDAAPESDEPMTDDERAAFESGWEEYLRGETIPFEDAFDRALAERTTSESATD